MDQLFTPADLVSVYTRAQAISDGILIDVSETAREAGFAIPVAVTRAVWADCVAWDDADNLRKGTLQDESGRLWDVVWMGAVAARRAGDNKPRAYVIRRVLRDTMERRPRLAALLLRIGPGDDGEPVATISQPTED